MKSCKNDIHESKKRAKKLSSMEGKIVWTNVRTCQIDDKWIILIGYNIINIVVTIISQITIRT